MADAEMPFELAASTAGKRLAFYLPQLRNGGAGLTDEDVECVVQPEVKPQVVSPRVRVNRHRRRGRLAAIVLSAHGRLQSRGDRV